MIVSTTLRQTSMLNHSSSAADVPVWVTAGLSNAISNASL